MRAGLRTDVFPGSCSPVGFVDGNYSTSVGLDDDAGKCAPPPPTPGTGPEPEPPVPGGPFPLISVQGREFAGMDDDTGNPTWRWAYQVDSVETIRFEEREEFDDRAGATYVRATATFLRSSDEDPIRETAMAKTSDGRLWRVIAATPALDRVTLTLRRVDDDAREP
jgi:hypothetical protein